MNKPPYIIVPYSRFSSDQQKDGDSTRRQDQAIKTLLDQNPKYKLDDNLSFFDRGLSAYTGANSKIGELAKILTMINDGTFPEPEKRIIAVEKMDRLTRLKKVDAFTTILSPIVGSGLSILIIDSGMMINKSNINDDAIFYPLTANFNAANSYVESLTARVQSAYDNKFDQLVKNKSIMGQILPNWLEYDDIHNKKAILLKQPESLTVKYILDLALKGQTSSMILKSIHNEGLAVLGKAKRWTAQTILRIITNPATKGTYTSKKRAVPVVVDGYYPPLITSEQFDTIQGLLELRKNKDNKTVKNSGKYGVMNLFSSISRCSCCNGGMNFNATTRGTGSRYSLKCNLKNNTADGCNASTVRYMDTEKAILNHLNELDLESLLNNDKSDNINLIDQLNIKADKLMKNINGAKEFLDQDFNLSVAQSLSGYEKEFDTIQSSIKQESLKLANVPTMKQEFENIQSLFLHHDLKNKHKNINWDDRLIVANKLKMMMDYIVMDTGKLLNNNIKFDVIQFEKVNDSSNNSKSNFIDIDTTGINKNKIDKIVINGTIIDKSKIDKSKVDKIIIDLGAINKTDSIKIEFYIKKNAKKGHRQHVIHFKNGHKELVTVAYDGGGSSMILNETEVEY